MLSAAVASAALALGAPVGVGTLAAEPTGLVAPVATADPVQGGWIRFDGAQGLQLARVWENGAVTPVVVPPLLRQEVNAEYSPLLLTPLRSGWLIVVGHFYPGGERERAECEGGSKVPPAGCGQLAAAELSPAGRWTAPQALPGSRGKDAAAAEAVELPGGRIELAWGEGVGLPTISVAVGRLGGHLGRPHTAQRLMRSEPEFEALENYDGKILVRGAFGLGRSESPEHVIERRLYGDGHLGPPLFRHGPLVADQGQRFLRPDGGETYVFEEGTWVGFALRAPGSSVYRREHLFSKDAEFGGVEATGNRRGQLLVVLRALRHSGSRLTAAEVSPHGTLEATHVLETGPREPGGYTDLAALAPGGQELVVGTGGAYAAAPRCRHFSLTRLTTPGALLLLFAGARGVFHLVWTDHLAIATTIARVECTVSVVR